ncbi:hypothetical protein AB3X55_03560 [Alphaproteobacteria bacterium LSUCC0719]
MIRPVLKPFVIILAGWLVVLALTTQARAQVCTGRFVNPVTDICWDCVFPITVRRGATGAVDDDLRLARIGSHAKLFR